MQWTKSVALVTGATSGIGLAVTRALVTKGVRVAVVGRSDKRLGDVARELGAERVAVFLLDVGDRAGIGSLPEGVVGHFGRLDIVVQSAGVNHRGPVSSRRAEDLAEILDVNLVGPVLLARAALPFLQPGAAIVNIASLAGKVPVPTRRRTALPRQGSAHSRGRWTWSCATVGLP
jgi:NAD(P)-dependent dehydrogenase (short-subunit alcohol dehydrogenase family)